MTPRSTQVTGLLLKWRDGDERAFARLIPLVHQELYRIARRHMAQEGTGHSLQATALVNEAYLRLVDTHSVTWNDRTHFLAVAARVMRHILVDYARRRRYHKRGGELARAEFEEALLVVSEPPQDFVALHDALETLAKVDDRKSRVVELRFFGGLTVDETAAILQVSADTVLRDWQLAKAWLRRELQSDAPPGA